jgi:hypothetical protein
VIAGFGIGWVVRRRRQARLPAGRTTGSDDSGGPSGGLPAEDAGALITHTVSGPKGAGTNGLTHKAVVA